MAKKKDNTIVYVGLGVLGFLLLSKSGGGGKLKSKYYTIADMQKSDTAVAEGITEQFAPPSAELVNNARVFVLNVLDPISKRTGQKAEIESWWRSDQLNEFVGGVPDSLHKKAWATDMRERDAEGKPNVKRLAQIILDDDIEFHKVILSGSIYNPHTLHISWKPSGRAGKIYYKSSSGAYTEVPESLVRSRLGF